MEIRQKTLFDEYMFCKRIGNENPLKFDPTTVSKVIVWVLLQYI